MAHRRPVAHRARSSRLAGARAAGRRVAWLAGVGAILAFSTVAFTALVQGPAHTRLAGGYDADAIRSLVRGNAPRTLAWTAHVAVFAAMLFEL